MGVWGTCVTSLCVACFALCAAFIDLSIAVVVLSIANLLAWEDLANARTKVVALGLRIIHTYLDATTTNTLAFGSCGAFVFAKSRISRGTLLAVVVDLAVAVVIDAIADLRGRFDLALAGAKYIFL